MKLYKLVCECGEHTGHCIYSNKEAADKAAIILNRWIEITEVYTIHEIIVKEVTSDNLQDL